MIRCLHLFTILYTAGLTYLLWIPDPAVWANRFHIHERYIQYPHLITFGFLGLLVELGRQKKSVVFWATLLFAYIMLTEIVQEVLPLRSFEVIDILDDVNGVGIGFYFAAVAKIWFKQYVSRRDAKNAKEKQTDWETAAESES
jgi:hypothetical protein